MTQAFLGLHANAFALRLLGNVEMAGRRGANTFSVGWAGPGFGAKGIPAGNLSH